MTPSPSNYSATSTNISLNLRAAAALFVAVGYCFSVGTTMAAERTPLPYDQPTGAQTDPSYRVYVKEVIRHLVMRTPSSISSFYYSQSYAPDYNIGSAVGIAVCYTRKLHKCRICLQEAAAGLKSCNATTTGSYTGARGCLIQFWQLYD